jgi:hypothetical protein
LALLAPGAGTGEIEALVERVLGAVTDAIELRATCAVWTEGDSGDDVIHRSQDELRAASTS